MCVYLKEKIEYQICRKSFKKTFLNYVVRMLLWVFFVSLVSMLQEMRIPNKETFQITVFKDINLYIMKNLLGFFFFFACFLCFYAEH